MKKTVSALLIATFVFSSAVTSFGQAKRTRTAPAGDTVPTRPSLVEPVATTEGETVQFDRIDAMSDGNGVFIRWRMQVETNNIGFNIYRIGGTEPVLVNERVVVSEALKSRSGTAAESQYELFDPQGGIATAYVIRSLTGSGSTVDSATFVPRSIRNVELEAGRSRESLMATALYLNNDVASRSLDLPRELRSLVDSNLLEPDLPMQQWVAGQPGVKIAVKQDGFYRVSRQQLLEGGFDVSSDSATWRLFMNGIEQAIIIGAGDQYIEFLGKGLDTRESDTRIYYLISGDVAGRRITSRVLRPIGGTVVSNNYRTTARWEENQNYIPNVINGEVDNYFGRPISQSPGQPVQFNVTGMDFTVPRQVLSVRLQGAQGITHNVKVVLNGHEVGHIGGAIQSVYQNYSEDLLVPSNFFVEGTNVLSLNETSSGRSNFFDSVSVRYSRKYKAEQNVLSFYTPGLRKVDLTGFTTSNIRLFDTTLDASPVQISDLDIVAENGTFTVKVPSSRAMVMFAVTEASILTSTSVTPNTPSTLAAPDNAADLVIISHSAPGFIEASEAWANYRRSRNGGAVTVKVVDVVDIYDEFSFGTHTAAAINNFLKHSTVEWQTPPRYALLIGDATQDPRNFEGFGFLDHVPTSMVSLIFEESGSDEALADFNHDGLADVAIGRIPTRDAGAVTTVLNKTIAFENPLQQSLDRGALLVYDLPQGYDFLAMSIELANELPDTMPKQYVNRQPPPDQGTANVVNAINSGKYIVNYSGHGASGVWASLGFFGVNNVPLLTNANNQSIFTMLTCYNGRFFQPQFESLGESLLKANNGGAVATWASTTETIPTYQLTMGAKFYELIGEGEIKRMGDLIKAAKATIAGSDVGYSWVLLGDPMLQVRAGAVQ